MDIDPLQTCALWLVFVGNSYNVFSDSGSQHAKTDVQMQFWKFEASHLLTSTAQQLCPELKNEPEYYIVNNSSLIRPEMAEPFGLRYPFSSGNSCA